MIDAKRAVVTGGAGFIGSHLVELLTGFGLSTVVVDNFAGGSRQNLAHIDGSLLEIHECDVRDGAALANIIAPDDVVFHLACLGVRHSLHDPEENHEVNATGTLRVLAACRFKGVRRFIYVSSSEVYGTALTTPMAEDHPTRPHTVYGASKLAGESYARAYAVSWQVPAVIVRPFNAFGPRSHHEGDRGEVIPRFMLRALTGRPLIIFGDGEQARDFTYVQDTAKGIMLAAGAEDLVGQTINVATGKSVTVRELAERIRAVVGGDSVLKHLPPRPGDVKHLQGDVALARKVLGFRPTTTLGDGLSRLRDWYAQSGQDLDDLLKEETETNWIPTHGNADDPALPTNLRD